jgi:hypothetical protein
MREGTPQDVMAVHVQINRTEGDVEMKVGI